VKKIARYDIPLDTGEFIHPLAAYSKRRKHETRALWVGVKEGHGFTFLQSTRISKGEMIRVPQTLLTRGTKIIVGATFDKELDTKYAYKLYGEVVAHTKTELRIALEVDPVNLADIGYIPISEVTGEYAPELTDPDERSTQIVTKAKVGTPQLLSESQAIFAKLAEYTLMDNSHLPVRVVADVTNCPDFASFQTALDKAGFTLRFAPKDSAAANLSAMSESDVLALLKRIPSDTLARELTNRGLEVIG
jgi:hypothetical protein